MADRNAPPEWKNLYQAALLEIDDRQVEKRIAEARDAITHRIRDLDARRSDCDGETQALVNALTMLHQLHRMIEQERADPTRAA